MFSPSPRQACASHAHTSSISSNLLSVPTGHQRSGSFGSSGTSVTSVWTSPSPSSAIATSVIENDRSAQGELFKLDKEEEIPDNPFAFTPKQLSKLHDPKDLNVLRSMGGLEGLVYGLRTNVQTGLSADEDQLHGKRTHQDVLHELEMRKKQRLQEDIDKKSAEDSSSQQNEDEKGDLRRKDSIASVKRKRSLSSRRGTMSSVKSQVPSGGFSDRKRIFSGNRIPVRKPKSIFQLMWMALHDKILVFPHSVAISDLRFF